MTVSSALPPLSSDCLLASENPTPRSPKYRPITSLPKLATRCKQVFSSQTFRWVPVLTLCTKFLGNNVLWI